MAHGDRRIDPPARRLPPHQGRGVGAPEAGLTETGRGGGAQGAAPPTPVALTFDDGPDPRGTPAVLRALDAIGARATFFMVAPLALRHPRLVRDVAAAGHEIGLHCWDHVRHTWRSRALVERDTDAALAALRRLGATVARWRTPWGDRAGWTGEVAAARGLALTGWTADTHDWRGDPAARMIAALGPGPEPGAVVLMHDGIGPGARRADCSETARLLGPLARLVRERGWSLGALSPMPGSS